MRKIVIDSRVIKHLGRDLITSPEVAVIELVKNAIDAKAKVINLHVCNGVLPHGLPNISEIANIPADYLKRPLLLVEDDGTGMTDQAIDNGFLRIATNIKTNVKDALGQKGIGRLATQRLGSALLVETSSSSEKHTSYVFIDWNEIINGVDEVPSFEAAATEHHTRLWVFGINLEDFVDNAIQFDQLPLNGTDVAATPVQINRDLRSALNFLISPFEANDSAPSINFFFDKQFRYYAHTEMPENEGILGLEREIDAANPTVTERQALVLSRIGQGVFRQSLFEKYNGKCIITGIDHPRLLVASHIKPWAVSSNEERLAVDNGLLLSATYDRLFDNGLITFDHNGQIFLSALIGKDNLKRLQLSPGMQFSIKANSSMKSYLEYHADVLFIR